MWGARREGGGAPRAWEASAHAPPLCPQAYNVNIGGYQSRGFVEVLAASQSVASKAWFQGTADAVRQYLWLFEEACREGVEDYLVLSGDHLYR